MPGRILIIDSVATNRIVLKVKLSSAFYQVEQAATAQDALAQITRTAPDLILLGNDLPDMTGLSLCQRLKTREVTGQIPVIMVAPDNSRGTRLACLDAGADDVICKPPEDAVLLARIRSLMRGHDTIEELRLRDTTARMLGFAEVAPGFEHPASVLFATAAPDQGVRWRTHLKPLVPYELRHHPLSVALSNLAKYPVPDAFVIALDPSAPEEGLRFIAEIRARSATRKAVILAVLSTPDNGTCVDALDLGANDVMTEGFDAEELSFRLATLIKRKRLVDRLRQNVQDGLNAAVTDPLTGLHNRRYALPQLARIARQARTMNRSFAVMVADLDHFKSINDRYGHAAGDVVLAEIARRMRETLTEADLIARIGGEEFLIVLQRADRAHATKVARRLCAAVRADPVYLQGRDIQIPVTVSIGVTIGNPPALPKAGESPAHSATDLIDLADQALYGAKAHGRDQVTLGQAPA